MHSTTLQPALIKRSPSMSFALPLLTPLPRTFVSHSWHIVRLHWVFVCGLSSRYLVCRPSHLRVCRVGTPPARK